MAKQATVSFTAPIGEVLSNYDAEDLFEYFAAEELLDVIDKEEIVEYLSKNGYQIADEQ